jgi:hypothetical protein
MTQRPGTQRFPIRIGPRSRPLLLLFGVRERNAYVDLGPDGLFASFGFYHLSTELGNISRWRIEGPWLWLTAIGVRRGLREGDITFGGNHNGGVRLDFKQRLTWRFLRVPRLYVTVADMEGMGAALTALGVPGEDMRKPQ